ncbi:MAG: hypothetical protein GY788_22895 [bacterium]|nr:hypothetical protein [bacterium]
MARFVPQDLRVRLEEVRLDLLALFRALDRLDLSPSELPQKLLRDLFELDADFAEALWALDQPPKSLDFQAMLRDTRASLKKLEPKRQRFLRKLPAQVKSPLERHLAAIRPALTLHDAYLDIPGRDPQAPAPFI